MHFQHIPFMDEAHACDPCENATPRGSRSQADRPASGLIWDGLFNVAHRTLPHSLSASYYYCLLLPAVAAGPDDSSDGLLV